MKRKCLAAFIIIFESIILLLSPISAKAQESSITSSLSTEESKIIIDESLTFQEILFLYATEALEKPLDLRLCAYEMFHLTPNENSCRDKYSAWHSESEYKIIESDVEGRFDGVGLEVANKDGKVVVVSPIDGSPAFLAGLKPDDVIFKINDKPVLNSMDAVTRIRGEAGSSVKITVKRNGKEINFNIVRGVIIVEAILSKIIDNPAGAIGYIKVKIFSKIMPEEFYKEISDLRNKGINKIILDLRNNPGGELGSALKILSYFARPEYISIVIRTRNEMVVVKNRNTGDFAGLKVVILVNNGSASASEIFVGAMKDWGFPVVGIRSFGKGVGQSLFPLARGSVLRLTTFEFLVGNAGIKINEVGVTPNYEIQDENEQLKKAVEILSQS